MTDRMLSDQDWEIRPMTREEYYLSREDEILAAAHRTIEKAAQAAKAEKSRNNPNQYVDMKQILQNLKNMSKEEEEREKNFKLGALYKKRS